MVSPINGGNSELPVNRMNSTDPYRQSNKATKNSAHHASELAAVRAQIKSGTYLVNLESVAKSISQSGALHS